MLSGAVPVFRKKHLQQQTRESSLVHHPALPLAFPDRTTLNSGIVLSVSEPGKKFPASFRDRSSFTEKQNFILLVQW